MKRICLACLSALIVGFGPPSHDALRAESVVGMFSANGVAIRTDARAGYDGAGSDPLVDYDIAPTDFKSGTADFLGGAAATMASATKIPAAGDPKDVADVEARTTFVFGGPFGGSLTDEVFFSVSGTVSAASAHNSAGNPAAANILAVGTAAFFVDAGFGGAPPPGVIVGSVYLPVFIAPRAPEGVKEVTVFENEREVARLDAESLPFRVPLYTQNGYRIEFHYSALAPFGEDPPFSFEYRVAIRAVPEPTTAVMMAAVSMAWLTACRRRKW